MSIYGKISTGMLTMEAPPRMAMRMAITTKVYGRSSASRTIHIGPCVERPKTGRRSDGKSITHGQGGPADGTVALYRTPITPPANRTADRAWCPAGFPESLFGPKASIEHTAASGLSQSTLPTNVDRTCPGLQLEARRKPPNR